MKSNGAAHFTTAPPTNVVNDINAIPARLGEEHPLRIAFVVDTFARDMGYANNTLCKYLARLGHDVHLVTSDLLPYFQLGSAASVYGIEFAERNKPRLGSERVDGFTVHTVRNVPLLGHTRLQGLHSLLRHIAPAIVCTFNAAGWIPLDCAVAARRNGYRFVIGNHTGKTAFPLAQQSRTWYSRSRLKGFATRILPGWFIGATADHCVVPTQDCAEVAIKFFGIRPDKVRVMNLPVDQDYFHPCETATEREERANLRASLGFSETDVVCVYSGKFTEGKNPTVLLQAIEILASQGYAVRGLFIGSGPQLQALTGSPLAVVVPFMALAPLGRHYRAADVGVWMEESTSFLDAASTGLPLVLGSTVKDLSHVREFTTTYASNDPNSLADAIRPMLDASRRSQIAPVAARLAAERFAASQYASLRVAFFRDALAIPRTHPL